MLVRPFIQPISSFDVLNRNGTAIIGVLGGDIVEYVNYEIYKDTNLVYSSTEAVTDIANPTTGLPIVGVRNFTITLNSDMGLTNNNSYTIRAYTRNSTETSGYSSVQYFSCYVTPIITLKDSENNTIGDNYEFDSQSGEITILFDKVSNASSATLNDIEINIYGVKGSNRDLVYSSGMVYTPYKVEFNNLLPTTIENPLYDSYSLELVAHTVQNMVLNNSYSNITCNYSITESAGLIRAENDASNGRIKVSFKTATIGPFEETPFGRSTAYSTTDGVNVYACSLGGKFAVYNIQERTFSSLITNPFGNKDLLCIATDGTNVYVAGVEGQFAIYNIQSQSFGSLITNPFGTSEIIDMATDGVNVYVCGPRGKFAIYNIQSQSFGSLISTPFGASYIRTLATDGTNVYVWGYGNKFAIYNIQNQSFGSLIANPFDTETHYLDFCTDGINVYASGSFGQFAIYNIQNQSFGALIPTPFETTDTLSTISDGKNVYVRSGRKLSVYSIQDGDFGTVTNVSGDYIDSFSADGENVYLFATVYSQYEQKEQFCVYSAFKNNIDIKRKTDGGEELCTLVSFKEIENPLWGNYFFYDYYTKTDTLYEYQIMSDETIEYVQVLSQFCGAYIADGTTGYEISEDWQIPDFNQNQKSVIYEPYGRKYPVVAYNALTSYSSGSDMAILRSENNRSNKTNNYLDRISQTKILKQFNSFLTNRRAKVRKDFNGNIAIVSILNSVSSSFIQELGNGIAKTQFSWVEIGDFTDEDFKKLGITNSFKIYAY